MAVNYYTQYVELFDFGKRTQREIVKKHPRNFYRISRYEYSDGDTKSLAGREASLIFVIGVFEDKVNCIKLNEVRPELFMRWFPTILKPSIKADDVDVTTNLKDLIIVDSIPGNKLFESKIKIHPIYKQDPRPYRTYNLDGLKYIQQINLKKDLIKTML
jgi:hypothetical protein